MWKKWANWFKGAIIGLVVGLFVSIGIAYNNIILTRLASPGLFTCVLLTECNKSGICFACNIVGLIFNLIYGFVIGAIIGILIDKVSNNKSENKKIKLNKKVKSKGRKKR